MPELSQALLGLLVTMLLLTLGPCVVLAQSTPQSHDFAPKRWSTIEIVTNDFDSVDRLRKAAGIPLGALLPINDPRIQQACESIRREVQGKVVHCRQFVGDEVDAEFLVEIDDQVPPAALPHCSPAQLAPDLAALMDEWGKITSTSKPTDDGPPERVNAQQYLDYNTPERHQQAERTHSIVRVRIRELEKASNSCTAQSRADAIGFMNYTGSPSRAIKLASAHMDDPDPLVRNSAVRLLGVFNRFISKNEVAGIVNGACALTSGGFADRNKSIILLDRMRLGGLVHFADLSAKCKAQIGAIARTSNAIQTGRPARRLVESAEPGL
jgi:hypothetical protein